MLEEILTQLNGKAQLVAVSKMHPPKKIMELYKEGQRIFGENRIQELVEKEEMLPKDIEWHMIGHLQTNKVKYMAPFVDLIHAVDSIKLLKEIDKQAKKNDRIINCLLQIKIARFLPIFRCKRFVPFFLKERCGQPLLFLRKIAL